MKYEIPCLLLVGSTLVPHWHLTFLHVDFCFALTWAVIRCRKQRKLSENQFAECKEYKPTLAYKCECRQKSLTLPNVGNICIHWILWDILLITILYIYISRIPIKLWDVPGSSWGLRLLSELPLDRTCTDQGIRGWIEPARAQGNLAVLLLACNIYNTIYGYIMLYYKSQKDRTVTYNYHQ